MAEVGSAYVSLLPSARGFASKMQSSVGPQIDSVARRTGSAFGKLFKVGAVAAFGGAALLGKFAADAIGEAREAQVVTARTENVIRSMGLASMVTAGQVGKLAAAISAKTGIDDEAIQSGQNLLLTFRNVAKDAGVAGGVFAQTSRLMVDLSTAMGSDAKGAAVQLGKALNDPIKGITALSRVGVSFSESQKEQIANFVEAGQLAKAQGIILGELKNQFGGAAEAMATPADKARVAWANFQEQIGVVLLPYLDKFLGLLSGQVIPAVARFAAQVDKGRGAGGRFRDVFQGLIDRVRPTFEDLRDIVAQFVGEMIRGEGAGGQFVKILTLTGSKLATAISFAKEHTTALGAMLVAVAATRVAIAAYSAAVVVVSTVTKVASVVQAAYAAVMGLTNSYLAVFLGVKGLEFAAWLRTTAATLASTAAMAANRTVYAGLWLTAFTIVKGAEFAAWVRSTSATVASTAAVVANRIVVLAVTVATKAWAATQWALNAALLANPVGLAIAAIAALAVGVIYAYKHSETFRDIVNKVWAALKVAGLWIADVAKKYAGLYVAAVQYAIGIGKQFIANLVAIGRAVIERVQDFGEFLVGVKDKIGAAFDFIKSIPGKIKDAYVGLATLLYSAGIDIIRGLINGIKSMASAAASAAVDVVKGAVDKAKSFLGIHSPSRLWYWLGFQSMEGYRLALKDHAPRVLDQLQELQDGLKSRLDSIRSDFASLSSSIASTFTGNLFEATTTGSFLNNLTDVKGNLRTLREAFKKLKKWGVPAQFLSQLFASGNSGLILDLASSGRGFALTAASDFASVNTMASNLGNQVARNQYGPQLQRVERRLERIEKAIHQVGPAVGRAVNGAAHAGNSGRTP